MSTMYTRYKRLLGTLLGRRRTLTTEEIFTEIFKSNSWLGKTSVSGSGSDPDQTQHIEIELPKLFRRLNVSTLLDIPCGDFSWMSRVDLSEIKYLGADIVGELISANATRYGSDNVSFTRTNMITDHLPSVDVILCRDGLVHLSFDDIRRALRNICNSGSTYLLTTTFPTRKSNDDIQTGSWRPLNLQIAPFNFPTSDCLIREGCTENDGAFRDKSLGLWKINELRNRSIS